MARNREDPQKSGSLDSEVLFKPGILMPTSICPSLLLSIKYFKEMPEENCEFSTHWFSWEETKECFFLRLRLLIQTNFTSWGDLSSTEAQGRMKLGCEAAERLQSQQRNERSPGLAGRGQKSRRGEQRGEQRHLGREADRKGGRGLRKAERKKRDETEPKKAFYFSSLKNKKQTLCFNWWEMFLCRRHY